MMARRMNFNHRRMMQWVLDHIDTGDMREVLDVGCGGGGPMALLSGKAVNARFTGLDLSRDMLRMTAKINQGLLKEGRLRTLQGSVTSLPFKDGVFDTVFACETTYFWPDLPHGFSECRRVVNDCGRLLLVQETWDAPQWRERNDGWQRGFRMRFCTLEGYRSMLERAGFPRVTTFTEEGEGWFAMVASAEGN